VLKRGLSEGEKRSDKMIERCEREGGVEKG